MQKPTSQIPPFSHFGQIFSTFFENFMSFREEHKLLPADDHLKLFFFFYFLDPGCLLYPDLCFNTILTVLADFPGWVRSVGCCQLMSVKTYQNWHLGVMIDLLSIFYNIVLSSHCHYKYNTGLTTPMKQYNMINQALFTILTCPKCNNSLSLSSAVIQSNHSPADSAFNELLILRTLTLM